MTLDTMTDEEFLYGNSRLTRTRFAIAPMDLLAQCKKRKGTVFVYLWLWDYAGNTDQAWPSLQRQADECGMKVDDVREARKWLCDNGWIQRRDRAGDTPLFRVRTERVFVPRSEPQPPNGGCPPVTERPLPKRGMAPLPQMGDPNKNQ